MSSFNKTIRHPWCRLVFPYLLIFLILEGIFGILLWRYLKEKEEFLLSRHIESLKNAYQVIVNNYKLASQIIYDEVINQPEIISLLQEAREPNAAEQQIVRQQLLEKLSPAYKRLQQHNLRQLHFHLPDGRSFLRFHRPEKFGDPLFDVRTSVRLANQQQRFVYGFEEGRIYNGFRYVFPLFATDNSADKKPIHLGSVETSVSYAAFKNEMASLFPGCFCFILRRDVVNAKVFQDEKSNYVPSNISDRFVTEAPSLQLKPRNLDCNIVTSLNQQLRSIVADKLKQGISFAKVVPATGDTPYVASFLSVKNFEGQSVAYIISYEIDRTIQGYYQTFYASLLGVTGTNLLLISFIAFAHRSYRLLRQNNDSLQQEIEARIIAERNEREKAAELSETLKQLKLAQAKLVQSEKMSSLNRLVAGIAHEINNPISFIRGNVQPAEEYLESLLTLIDYYQDRCCLDDRTLSEMFPDIDLDFIRQDFPRVLTSMKQGSERVRDVVQTLRNFSRLDESDLKSANLHEGLESTVMMIDHRLKSTNQRPAIEVVREYNELPFVECYPSLLNQAVLSILTNAVDALDSVNWFQVGENSGNNLCQMPTIRLVTAIAPGDTVMISIANNGPAIPDNLFDRIFDPFFTTKPVGKGTGLGLSTVYAIVVEHHHGKLTCQSPMNGETIFTLQIPIRQANYRVNHSAA
ncbi:ATP-binding protein [Floridanema fluviatile]